RWLPTHSNTPNPGSSPQPSTTSCMVRPTSQAPAVLNVPSRYSLSTPVAEPEGGFPVAPRPAKHPVVQPFAALAEARAGPVVRAGDVPVQRHRHARQYLLRHLVP